VKKINLSTASLVREDQPNEDGAFSNEDAQECTGTSSKGPSNKSHPNDQVVESPLKKTKKKIRKSKFQLLNKFLHPRRQGLPTSHSLPSKVKGKQSEASKVYVGF